MVYAKTIRASGEGRHRRRDEEETMSQEHEHPFEIASGSVTGRLHMLAGKTNQDACAWRMRGPALVAVVTDGCGSGAHCEVGAQIGARLVVEQVLARLEAGDPLESHATWEKVRAAALAALAPMAKAMGGRLEETITDFFLFTVLGLAIAGGRAVIFGIGDGMVAIGDERLRIGPFSRNAPPYIAYGLVDEGPRFMIHRAFDTRDIDAIMLGTDGAADLDMLSAELLPGSHQDETVGPLSKLWTEDRFFDNRDAMRRWLSLLNRGASRPAEEERRMTRRAGLLEDDTTLVVIRRRRAA